MASAWTITSAQPASTKRSRSGSGSSTMRCASNGRVVHDRQAAMTSGPNVRFGTNCPSITSHWMRSDAGGLELLADLTEPGEVRRQHRGDDERACTGHTPNLVAGLHLPGRPSGRATASAPDGDGVRGAAPGINSPRRWRGGPPRTPPASRPWPRSRTPRHPTAGSAARCRSARRPAPTHRSPRCPPRTPPARATPRRTGSPLRASDRGRPTAKRAAARCSTAPAAVSQRSRGARKATPAEALRTSGPRSAVPRRGTTTPSRPAAAGGADDHPDVGRVVDAVEDQHRRPVAAPVRATLEEGVERLQPGRDHVRGDALVMATVAGDRGDHLLPHPLQRDAASSCGRGDGVDHVALRPLGDEHLRHRHVRRAERLEDRLAPVDHQVAVDGALHRHDGSGALFVRGRAGACGASPSPGGHPPAALARDMQCHGFGGPASYRRGTSGDRNRPRPQPMAIPPATSDAWCRRT